MTPFRIAIMGIFIVAIVAGVFVFAGVGGLGKTTPAVGDVVIWGTLPTGSMQAALGGLPYDEKNVGKISYVEKSETALSQDLVNTLASGTGPDLVILSQEQVHFLKDKLLPVPFSSYSERTFRDAYLSEGGLFLSPEGVLAFPLVVDPLLMYWNPGLLAASGVASVPKTWDELIEQAPKLSSRDGAGNLVQSAIPLGEFRNIENAKAILSTLFIQAGVPIVDISAGVPLPALVLPPAATGGLSPSDSALRFYADFANPAKSVYSWNRSRESASSAFLAEDAALYLGFASEYPLLKARNPNLSFDAALMPQIRGGNRAVTFGKLYGLAIPKTARNSARLPGLVGSVVSVLAGTDGSAAVSGTIGIPSARRDVLSAPSGSLGPVSAVFYQSALIADGWLDPEPAATRSIFGDMVESVTSGRLQVVEAIQEANERLSALLPSAETALDGTQVF